MPLRCAFFDWGGTLAAPHQRPAFLHGDAGQQLGVMHKDAIPLLVTLKQRGIGVCIITNTSYNPELFELALARSPINRLVDAVVQSSEGHLCAKPCTAVYTEALERMNVAAADAVMVGNSLEADVLGARMVGMATGWVRDGNLVLAFMQASRERDHRERQLSSRS